MSGQIQAREFFRVATGIAWLHRSQRKANSPGESSSPTRVLISLTPAVLGGVGSRRERR